MFRNIVSLTLTLLATSAIAIDDQHDRDLRVNSRNNNGQQDLKITVTNLAYQQPMGPFFVAVHNEDFPPLYQLGKPAPPNGLNVLAEDRDPQPLIDYYSTPMLQSTSRYVDSFVNQDAGDFPAFLLEDGESTTVTVTVNPAFPYVSMASMAVNTNDCFVGFAGRRLEAGTSFMVPGLDSGTEENNEDCTSIPGPACAMTPGNVPSGNGEGTVLVHRGIHGMFQGSTTDLDPDVYDWRNPMLLVTVEAA